MFPPMNRAVGTVLVTAALVMAASACGGSSSSSSKSDGKSGSRPVGEWVATLCSNVSTWKTAVTNSTTRLTSGIDAAATSTDSAKAAVASTLDGSVQATDTLIAALNNNGAPDIANGAEIQQKVVSAFQDGRQVFVEARARADALPADAAGFAQQATQLASSIETGFNSFGTALGQAEKLDSDHKIDQAASKDAACKQLSGA
jgi:hypothetical protein